MFAITQPVLALFVEYPQFFAARATPPDEIYLWLALLIFAAPICLSISLVVVRRASKCIGEAYYYGLIFFLTTLIILPILARLDFLQTQLIPICSLGVALLFVLLYQRTEFTRQILSFMLVAIIAFPLIFIFNPKIRPLILPAEEAGKSRELVKATIPVVMLVLDELPLISLMNMQQVINKHRYPNFFNLAATSTWYRNATTVADSTAEGIPALLTGTYPSTDAKLLTYADHKRNLFTLLGDTHSINAVQGAGNLCPKHLCSTNNEVGMTSVLSLLEDTLYVYAHIVAPPGYRSHLPVIDQNWQDFARHDSSLPPEADLHFRDAIRKALNSLAPFSDFIDSIRKESSPRLDYIHLLFPHAPFKYLPSGKVINGRHFNEFDGLVDNSWQSPWPAVQGQQRSILQLAHADALLGQLMDKLMLAGLFDESLIIVTSDHGASYRDGEDRRHLSKGNYMDILPIPLFIKVPGQTQGFIDDSNVESVDILPTIADILGIENFPGLDGHSLLPHNFDNRSDRIEKHAFHSQSRTLESYPSNFELTGLNSMIDVFGIYPEDVYNHGPNKEIVGHNVEDLKIERIPAPMLSLDIHRRLQTLDPRNNFLPARITGVFHGTQPDQVEDSLRLAIAVNGTIVTTVWSYQHSGQTVFSALLPELSLSAGKNDVQVYIVKPDKDVLWLQSVGINPG